MNQNLNGALGDELSWPAPAKLNLLLHVIGRRPDGYHELQTLFQFLDYGDELRFVPRQDTAICRLMGPGDLAEEDDLVVRAARLLQSESGCGRGADIHLHKRLPIGAGLGGGSSDAATTLVALNHLWGLGWNATQLAALGLKLGADVPVFIHGRAAWAEGVGEILTPIELPEPWYLVLTPDCQVSTREIFNAPDLKRDSLKIRPPAIKMPQLLSGVARNDCLPVVRERYPGVAEAFDLLGEYATPQLTGTGASVFAAFESRDEARRVQARMPPLRSCFVARGLNRSPLMDLGAVAGPKGEGGMPE